MIIPNFSGPPAFLHPHCSWISSCLGKQNLLELIVDAAFLKVAFCVISVRDSFIIKMLLTAAGRHQQTWKSWNRQADLVERWTSRSQFKSWSHRIDSMRLREHGLPLLFRYLVLDNVGQTECVPLKVLCLRFGLIYEFYIGKSLTYCPWIHLYNKSDFLPSEQFPYIWEYT